MRANNDGCMGIGAWGGNNTRLKFTPEPWSVGILNDGDLPRFTVEREDGHIIAYVEEKADAHLISAALDVYQALQGFLAVWQHRNSRGFEDFEEWLKAAAEDAEAAINKAEGR